MPDQVPEDVKHDRLERLVETTQRIAAERNADRVGRVEEVLVEGRGVPMSRCYAAAHAETRRSTSPVPPRRGVLQRSSSTPRPRRRSADAKSRSPPPSRASRDNSHLRHNCHTHATTLAIRSKRVVGWGAPRAMTRRRPEVIAVFGPTGSGKTSASEIVARALGTEIVSADALQVYRGLPILTNQSGRATRLVAIRDLSQEFSVGEYARLAHAEIHELVGANEIAVVCGGTGLYLRAAIVDLDLPPAAESSAQRAGRRLRRRSRCSLCRLRADAAAASRVHLNDRRRVVRALELAEHGESLTCARSTVGCRHAIADDRRRARDFTHFSRAQDP